MKKPFRLLPLVFAVLLVACGCKKEPNKTTLSGRVIEYGTAKPVHGAAVYLISQQGDPFGTPVYVTTDSFLTDADGAFHREYLDKDLPGGEAVLVYKAGYRKEDDLPFHNGENNLEVVLQPYAWFKLVPIADQGESLIAVTISELGYGLSIGQFSDSIQTFQILGNRNVIIRWGPWGSSDKTEDSIYCPGHDTTTYDFISNK